MPRDDDQPAREADATSVALRRLLSVTGASLEQRAQLESALRTRVVIEQAKGVLAERLRIDVDDAFRVLRNAARTSRRRIHELAREIVDGPDTPAEVVASLHETLRRREGRIIDPPARQHTTP